MATQAKFNTVLPSNTIQQGLNYTGISSVYASKLNTLGQAENVMTANDVELSLNTYNPGSTASINIPASYKLLGNMYLKLKVRLSTLLLPAVAANSVSYDEICTQQNTNKNIIFSNCPPSVIVKDQAVLDGGEPTPASRTVTTGTLNTGMPLDISFLAYNLIKQFTYRIPGCDRIYMQGIHMVPHILDKCPNDEEKQKIAMMSGTGHYLYTYNMTRGKMKQTAVNLKLTKADATALGRTYICESAANEPSMDNPVIIVNEIEDPEFVIYALLPMPWSTIDKDKPGLYYPAHMTTSALELNIQFQDSAYMRVPAETGYSGYRIEITDASLRYTYANVATLTYYKPPIYKLPCSLPYCFTFPVDNYGNSSKCAVNLLGLKNGEITQLMMFLHQAEGGSFFESVTVPGETQALSSMRFKWRNEPLKNVQVEYAGQIIWKGLEDGYDFMNQFDNRKSWGSFKMPSLLLTKSVPAGDSVSSITGSFISNNEAPAWTPFGLIGQDRSATVTSYGAAQGGAAGHNGANPYYANGNAVKSGYNTNSFYHSAHFREPKTSLSNGYDISHLSLGGAFRGEELSEFNRFKRESGLDQYVRAIFSNSFYASSGSLPFGKVCGWETYWADPDGTIFDQTALISKAYFDQSYYNYGDQCYWTTIPVAEKIDQIRGPRDYALGADFKDSNLIVKFDGWDVLQSSQANSVVKDYAKNVKWNLQLVATVTSAFIFNGDRAELMQ